MVKSDSADAFKVQYNMLVITGMWPKKNPNIIYRIRTTISWICAIGLFGCLLTQFIYDIKDFMKLSVTLYILVCYMGFILKLLVFINHREEFLNILNFLKNPIFISYPEDLDYYMTKSIKQSVLVARTVQIATAAGLVVYAVYPILDKKPLPFPFPYELGKYTLLMFCFQMVAEAFSAVNNLSLDLVFTSLMGIVAAQLDILAEMIMRLKEDDSMVERSVISNRVDESINKKLKDCVKHHLAIIK
ncbi:hypothetical protein ILUMI_17932 [Ignelater luminosus]|uniref:Uncharacterized protein n=1 Tax=Ignelater luminosus TaxID=2038154 RepID=A0A8K0G724_IGNLU|nr:hypothetical protein ILUMI_17932 [Ignelater luminosus]